VPRVGLWIVELGYNSWSSKCS